jgi:hypothetical protein
MDNNSKLIDKESSDTKTKDENNQNKDDADGATDIIEGLTEKEGYGFIAVLIILSTPLAVYFIKNIYSDPYKFFKSEFETILTDSTYDKEKFKELYNEYKASLRNNKLLYHKYVLAVFLGFSYMAFLVNTEDENLKEPAKWIIASIVGATLFIFKFIPSIISFSENVFGYFFMNIFGSINLSLSLKNGKFTGDEAKIKLNKLMTIFNVENLGEKFNQIGIYNREPEPNKDPKLFAIFDTNEGPAEGPAEQMQTYRFFEYLLNASILKRSIGEVTMLLFSTLISISLFKNYEGFG